MSDAKEDHPKKRQRESGYANESRISHQRSNQPNTSLIVKATKNKARARWWKNLQVAEVQVMKGNFWKTMGYTESGNNFLYGEEALFLMEKDQLAVLTSGGDLFTRDTFYETVISGIALECYLTFAKLKVGYSALTSYSMSYFLFDASIAVRLYCAKIRKQRAILC